MGAAIPYTSSRAPAAALGFFQTFFFAVCLVVPLLWLLLLALLWLVPLHATTQRRLLVAAEVAHAWSALDVFLLTLVSEYVSECVSEYVRGYVLLLTLVASPLELQPIHPGCSPHVCTYPSCHHVHLRSPRCSSSTSSRSSS